MSKYNANVRIGNWFYDLILQDEKARQYMKKSTEKQLKVQRTRQLFLSMLKEVPLTFPVVGLSYGAIIQIVSPEMPPQTRYKIQEKQGIALGADIHFSNVDDRQEFAPGDSVIGTGILTPCVRNVWTLVPEDKSRMGTELRFGDMFHMQLVGSKEPLYLECILQSPSAPKGNCNHVTPKLSSWTGTNTAFKVASSDPSLRYETEGAPVPPFEKIAIIQTANSQSLAVEPDSWFPTFLGMECEISVHTFREFDKPNTPDPRNYWCFILSSA